MFGWKERRGRIEGRGMGGFSESCLDFLKGEGNGLRVGE